MSPLNWFKRKHLTLPSMRQLSRDEYLATFSGPNKGVGLEGYDLTRIWAYVSAIPPDDHEGYNIAMGDVQFVYRTQTGEFHHVLVSTTTPNAFVVVIVRVESREIIGHHLLDLSVEYGIERD